MSELRISASGPESLIESTATSIPSDIQFRKNRAPPPCAAWTSSRSLAKSWNAK
ncbi:BQ5605_C008g05130 [Microbotryum silenes-dioicae]|uniref:BQ5605_C008g05130 protein n=1 Tax=Microbotryum silenes-dioicae TaxID=796604 RepID=A0A2X0MGD5_9BASI|nr:BQ5605_C008g05130 [Microbotryum silenes-dioicae]